MCMYACMRVNANVCVLVGYTLGDKKIMDAFPKDFSFKVWLKAQIKLQVYANKITLNDL